MAIIHQAPGQGLVQQPVQSFIDTSPKGPIFRSELNERSSFVDPAKSFENYFGRVHRKYKSMDTTNIENLANRLLQEQDSAFMDFVREATLLRDTFLHRFLEAKTPLGQVLQELQNSQESRNRKLLPKEIFRQAEKEVKELTEKEVALATEKGKRREGSNEISHLDVSYKKREAPVSPISPEIPVNTYVTNDQRDPVVTQLTNGDFVVIWSGEGLGDIDGIFGRIFNRNGGNNTSEFPVNSATGNYQVYPALTGLSNGDFVASWHSFGDAQGFGVFGRIFYPNSTEHYPQFQANTYTASDQKNAAIAPTNDNFVMSWESPQDGSGIGIRGQLFYPNRTKISGEIAVNTYTPAYQDNSALASLNNGEFLVVYESHDPDVIRGQAFNPDRTKIGTEKIISTSQLESQLKPSVAALDNNKYAVAWHSEQDGSNYGIFAQIVNRDGSKSGAEIRVNTVTQGFQMNPSVAPLENGMFVIVWRSVAEIFGQIFNADGSKNGGEFPVNSFISGNQLDPSVAYLGNNTFVVAWESQNQDTSGYGIFARIFGLNITTSSTSTSSSITSSSSASTQALSSTSSNINTLATTSLPFSSTSSNYQTTSPSSNNLSTKNVQSLSNSGNSYSTSSNNNKIILYLALGIIGGVASVCLLSYLYARRRKSANRSQEISFESIKVEKDSFELDPTMKIQHLEIGDEYIWLDKIDRSEAADIYNQTGYLFTFPKGKDAIKSKVGKGCFGKIRIAKRKKDGEYVAVKRIKKENMEASREEAKMQQKAQGPNILPIYNTVTFENSMYHFLPLAGLGSGLHIQKQLSGIRDPKLASEILKFVAKDVLTGLQTIHEKDLCHLDMKASNIVFKDDGTAYITDFGCAKDGKILLKTHGDKDYFSPGRLAASSAGDLFDGQKADMWATGIMLLGMYKNKSPSDLFGPRSDWSEDILDEFFQEKLDQFEELQSPNEGTIWWVIKHLLDTSEETRFTANQALDAACFKGLLKSIQSTLFQNMRSNNLIGTAHIDREIDISDYGFASALQALREEERTLEIQELILNYDFQPEVTPENIRSGENTDYQFSPRLLPEEDPAVLRDYSFSP
ncbi:MAG: Serine/threonine-protein kinase StkP [Candidatus Anoxychlamydiales bacterium]|nr:Serine/threonine-protein kinase StkP [Candidatus Anoxychlamydiales bacterium]